MHAGSTLKWHRLRPLSNYKVKYAEWLGDVSLHRFAQMHVSFASKFGLSQYSKQIQNFTELNGVCRKRFASEHEELLMEGLDLPDLPSARNPQWN